MFPYRYRKGMDTLDVWFDSGTSWLSAWAGREDAAVPRTRSSDGSGGETWASFHPADLVLEGSDQHRHANYHTFTVTHSLYPFSATPARLTHSVTGFTTHLLLVFVFFDRWQRLVPVRVAHVCSLHGQGAVQGHRDTRIHSGRKQPQDEQVSGKRHRSKCTLALFWGSTRVLLQVCARVVCVRCLTCACCFLW